MNQVLAITPSQVLINAGIALFVLGLAHLIPGIALRDAQAFRYLHTRLRGLRAVFSVLWHLGRTPFALLTIALMTIYRPESGITLAIIFILIVSLEWFIKRSLQRVRPFKLIPDTIMSQPREPRDPSFPSGDALRVWFLALSLPIGFGAAWTITASAVVVAMLISLGRIGMGIHYPLDVLGGSGLGLIGAGIFLRTLASLV
jgi:undecaprenyl-diphosphatase